MSQMETHNEKPAELANAQAAFLDSIREANQHWFERLHSEANLAAEAVSNMTKARSVPDAMIAWQAWNGRRFEVMAQDGRRLLADAQKLIELNSRLLSQGWVSNGKEVSS